MEIIIRGKGSSKTLNVIKAADKCNGYIVCINHQEANRVFWMAKELGYDIYYPLTLWDFIAKKYSDDIGCLYIDNADMLLQMIARVPIKIITMSRSPKEPTP